jgi:choline dehydrogenase-like flavoprotein
MAKAMKRKNCKVRTGAMVRRINFDKSKTAVGVTYDLVGDDTCAVSYSMFILKATREVSLSLALFCGSDKMHQCPFTKNSRRLMQN